MKHLVTSSADNAGVEFSQQESLTVSALFVLGVVVIFYFLPVGNPIVVLVDPVGNYLN